MNTRIKELRKEAKDTQEALAKKICVTRVYVTQMETGTSIPSQRVIRDICRVYNSTEEWLTTGKGEKHILPTDEDTELIAKLLVDKGIPFRDDMLAILKVYLDLPDDEQKVVKEFIRRVKERREKA